MLVSELEKNAEIRISNASAAKSRPSEDSFKSGCRLYDSGSEMVEKKPHWYKPLVATGCYRVLLRPELLCQR